TDDNGYFELPPMFERTVTKLLPMEFVTLQRINVIDGEEQYEIWRSIKRDPKENTEARGKKLEVVCEMLQEEKGIIVDGVVIHSKCTWDVEVDEPIDWTVN